MFEILIGLFNSEIIFNVVIGIFAYVCSCYVLIYGYYLCIDMIDGMGEMFRIFTRKMKVFTDIAFYKEEKKE